MYNPCAIPRHLQSPHIYCLHTLSHCLAPQNPPANTRHTATRINQQLRHTCFAQLGPDTPRFFNNMHSKWIKRAPLLGALGILAGGVWYTAAEQAHAARGPVSANVHAAMGEQCSSESNTGIADSTTATSGTSTSSNSGTGDAHDGTNHVPTRKLFLHTGACMKPHPDKVAKGGEDAYYVAENKLSLGVADGVGGWADIGVDAGEYSRMLMDHARAAARTTAPGAHAPQTILDAAYRQTTARGSCTACILVLDADELYATNLGDSGFMVIRGGNIIFQSPQQQHGFNYPYQLGNAGTGAVSDPPSAAQTFSIKVQQGDIVVAGTDGLLDNVFPDEAAAIATVAQRKGESPGVAAEALTAFARMRAADKQVMSPFAYAAQSVGLYYLGGKMDDITVLVAYVDEEGKDGSAAAGRSAQQPTSKL